LPNFTEREERIADIAVRKSKLGGESSGEGLGVLAGIGLEIRDSVKMNQGRPGSHHCRTRFRHTETARNAHPGDAFGKVIQIRWAIAGHQEMAGWGAVTFEVNTRYRIKKQLSIVRLMLYD
jgi:hypothetical protein